MLSADWLIDFAPESRVCEILYCIENLYVLDVSSEEPIKSMRITPTFVGDPFVPEWDKYNARNNILNSEIFLFYL